MWIVLGVLVAGGTAGYVYTKCASSFSCALLSRDGTLGLTMLPSLPFIRPIRELAEKAHSAIDTAKAGGEQASGLVSISSLPSLLFEGLASASSLTTTHTYPPSFPQTSQVASLAGLGPALAISQTLYNKIQEHGGVSEFVTGLSDDLKNQNIDGALEKIKKVGGKDIEPYIKQVESALKEAKGKIQDVDWKVRFCLLPNWWPRERVG